MSRQTSINSDKYLPQDNSVTDANKTRNHSMADDNIKVVVRVRPFNKREKDRKAKCVVEMKGTENLV